MKGKRSTTEDRPRILRDADRGKSILEGCREHNLSEVSFHRWEAAVRIVVKPPTPSSGVGCVPGGWRAAFCGSPVPLSCIAAVPPSARQTRLARRRRVLSGAHPRYGYRDASPPSLRQEGWAIGKRQVQRLRRADGLRVPPTKRQLVRRGISTGLPTKATPRGHVWTWDFISDATVRGGALKMLTILR